MGSGASSSPPVGVSVNPRVEHAFKLAQKEGKAHLIDTPVLLDLSHGTIRYRYKSNGGNQDKGIDDDQRPALADSKTEGPHYGSSHLQHKKGYFFHTKLPDYSIDPSQIEEQDYRFKYVFRGPQRARNKKLFFVTGRGLKDSADSYPSRVSSPRWPNIEISPSSAYYSIELAPDDTLDGLADSNVSGEAADSHLPVNLTVTAEDSIHSIRESVSLHILKPASNIHVFFRQKEIRPDTKVSDIFNDQPQGKTLNVKLLRLQ